MTEKLEGMTLMPKNAKKSATPDEAERAAIFSPWSGPPGVVVRISPARTDC